MLNLLPEPANPTSCVFTLIFIGFLTASIIILLCNLVKHADLTVELLNRRLVDTLMRTTMLTFFLALFNRCLIHVIVALAVF